MQIHNQTLFFRNDLVKKYGLFDESYHFAFDYEFITRFTASGTTTVRKAEGLGGALRVHAEAKSSNIASTVGKTEHARVKELYISRLGSSSLNKMRYLWCRFSKIAYFVSKFDLKYISYRFSK